jgi:ATP phosphoribosyltransferase regulatory subunit HisZ
LNCNARPASGWATFLPTNLITQEHIENALRKQRRLRMAAAIATSLLAPLETYAASALPAARS